MKKIALVLGFFCLYGGHAFSQSNWDGTGFRFGMNASPSFSWMKSNDKLIESAGTNLGLKLAVQGENYFTPNYAVFSGIGFNFNAGGTVQYGYAQSIPWPQSPLTVLINDTLSLPQDVKLHYRTTYVEIPVGLRMRGGTSTDAPISYFIEAPVFTLGIVTKALGDIRGATNNFNTEDEDIRDDVNGLSLSWGLGAGIEYEMAANATLVAGLYYQNQFTDLTSDKARVFDSLRGSWRDEDSKTSFRAFTVRIGVYF
jgi:hypothetical protein